MCIHRFIQPVLLSILLFSVARAEWTEPITITSTGFSTPVAFRSGLDPSSGRVLDATEGDTLHVVWQKRTGLYTSNIYYANSYDGGISWSAETALSSLPDDWESAETVSVSVSGQNVYVVWVYGSYENYLSDGIVYRRSTDAGQTWSNPVYLAPGYHGDLTLNPQVVAVGDQVHVAWNGFSATPGDEISKTYYCVSHDGGQTWGTPIQVSDHPEDSNLRSIQTTLAVSGNDVHIAWEAFLPPPEDMFMFYRHSPDNGVTWDDQQELESDNSLSDAPFIAASNGAVHFAWAESVGDGFWEIHYRRSLDNGDNWSDPVTLDEGLAGTVSAQPNLVCRGSQVNLAFFRIGADPNYKIYFSQSNDDGATWSEDTLMFEHCIQPHLAANSSKLFMVWVTEFFEQIKSIYNDVGVSSHPPSSFGLTEPEQNSSINPTEAENLQFVWEESTDPDSGDVVSYDLHITVEMFGDPIVNLTYSDIVGTTHTINLLEESGFNPPTSPLTVHWNVTARSAGDSRPSNSTFTFIVAVPQLITVGSPNGGEIWDASTSQDIQWSTEGIGGSMKIELNRNYPTGQWETIVASMPNSGHYIWTVTAPGTTTARIRISSVVDTNLLDVSDGNFTIHSGSAIGDRGSVPLEFDLLNPYPNPFNSSAEISFNVPFSSRIELKIFNTIGQEMITLVDGMQFAGTHTVRWNGTSSTGRVVPSGMYLCQMKASGFVETRKILLLK